MNVGMAIEKTLLILKPDALKKGVEYEILDKIQKKGFIITGIYKASPKNDLLLEHYKDPINKYGMEMGDKIMRYMTSGPVIVAIIEGNNAAANLRVFSGEKTDPTLCSSGTIRGDYSCDSNELSMLEKRATENIIHTSDSPESAEKEINLWFKKYLSKNIGLEKYDEYDSISRALNYVIPNFMIKSIVFESNNKKMLYHGIKRKGYLESVLKHGVAPLTPEEGPCSFWSSGLSLFHPIEDSPVFRYSGYHSDEKSDVCELNLAMANYNVLEQKGIELPKYENDSQLHIKDVIPFENISLINVRVKHPINKDVKTLRSYAQIAEQILVRGISEQLFGAFTPGKKIEYKKEIKEVKNA